MSIVLLIFGNAMSARAATSEVYVGAEAQIHRETVTPEFFPILDFGLRANNLEDAAAGRGREKQYDLDPELRVGAAHPTKVFALTAHNLYWGDADSAIDSSMHFSFGRRLVGWSKLDELWGLGEFEPLDSWDRLRSSPQGLTGIFVSGGSDDLRFNFFASYLFIPEITPNIVIENHRFVLEHPQAISTAPQTYTLLNRPTPLGYELMIPGIDKIIFRPSIALSLETGRSLPFKLKGSYGYLPLNYFPIALEASLAIPLDQIIVDLHPRLLHHHLYNIELSAPVGQAVTAGIVGMINDPVTESSLPADYTATRLTTSYTLAPWIGIDGQQWSFNFSQLRTWKGLDPDVGPYASPDSSIFSSRMLYRAATQIKARYYFSQVRKGSAYLDAKYLHEYSIDADWIAADFVSYLMPQLSLLVGGDLINAERTVSEERGAEFLADVRAIDRIRVGVQYVF